MANAISSITLCRVPITATHQIDFKTIDEQREYFKSNARRTYEKCKYQARTGTMKVKGYVDDLNDCNYGYYTNSYKGTQKTYYFWIVSKNLLARETTELTIQLDVFQTWLFDFKIGNCMIEREHTDNDILGRQTMPEDFELGEYITRTKKSVEALKQDPCFFVGVTDEEISLGGKFGRTYSGFAIVYFKYSGTKELSEFIEGYMKKGKADAIAFIFSFPSGMFNRPWDNGERISGYEGVLAVEETFGWNTEQSDSFSFLGETYKPYNNKLYTYPYNFITVKNASGGNVVLKLEQFSSINDIKFKIECCLTQNPTITLTPTNYNNKTYAIDDSIQCSGYGLCSWNNDNYANWFAQHQNSINAQSVNASNTMKANANVNSNNYNNALSNRDTNATKGAINTAISTLSALGSLNIGGAIGNAVGGSANTMLDYSQATKNANNDLGNSSLMNTTNYQNEIRSLMASVKDASVQPNTAKGDTSSCGLDLARNTATFFIEQTQIKPEYAKKIDMYFQMFGYKVNRVGKPNMRSRARWNYVKTVNSNIYGTIPFEDTQALNDLFNNGFTIWHKENYMFDYDVINNIVFE